MNALCCRCLLTGLILLVLLQSLPSCPRAHGQTADQAEGKREKELEERLKRLEDRYEAMERRHAESYGDLKKRYDDLSKQFKVSSKEGSRDPQVVPNAASARPDDPPSTGDDPATADLLQPTAPAASLPGDIPRDITGDGAEDLPVSLNSPSASGGQGPQPLKGTFGRGFSFETEDGEYQFQFHYLGQVDVRQYARPNQDPVHSGFSFPRQRLYFTGRMTKLVEYYVTLNKSFGQLDVFDAFLNFRMDDRLQVKVGRYKTPYSYEFYAISAPDFLVPERSLFASNFSPNRQLGLMAWGQLFDRRLDYAAGIFNGNRFSFQDTNEPKNIISYLNVRPFEKANDDWAFLRFLNLGGSVDFGNEFNVTPQPYILRTSVAASNAVDATNIAPPFLAYKPTVSENGNRSLWGLHFAYFYKSLSLLGEWNSGYYTLKASDKAFRTQVPLEGFYVAAGYFLTGETLDRRAPIKPLRPFKFGDSRSGPGAIELVSRFSGLQLGPQVFTGGLANPSNWTNRVSTIDVGINWYPTQYVKLVAAWEHAMFATPVLYRPDASELTSDLFWLRAQVYF